MCIYADYLLALTLKILLSKNFVQIYSRRANQKQKEHSYPNIHTYLHIRRLPLVSNLKLLLANAMFRGFTLGELTAKIYISTYRHEYTYIHTYIYTDYLLFPTSNYQTH